jgi:C_GCAxxG_C_C family probable redox protein
MIDLEKLSPERRKVWDKINEMMDVSYGCAESFVAAVGEYLWGEVDVPIRMISTGFSGGVGGTHEELCGGVSGAAIILGLLYGRTTNDEALMIRCKRLISEQRDRFIQEFGTTVCQELRDAQFGADEQNPCSAMIAPAAFILLDILEEEQERERAAAAAPAAAAGADVLPLKEYISAHGQNKMALLIKELERPELPHQHRNWIGEMLNELGDSRKGVGLLLETELPEICWEKVPGGEVEVERAGKFVVEPFLVSRYPITKIQFQAFLDAQDGFHNQDWWAGLNAQREDIYPAAEQRFNYDNHPRDNVSWFDAVAYCRWLNAQYLMQDDIGENPVLDHDGWEIRLPTEWEWQMAATGGIPDHKFPWGLDWDENRAHTKHNQLNKSIAVGMYPAGISPIGALDMSGNIWEWCLNCYENPGELDLSREDRRVLRGGSWYHWGSYAHTDMRSRYYPGHRYNAGGFRIACGKTLP